MFCFFSQFYYEENSNNGVSLQQNEPFSSPKTIEKTHKDIENENAELENIPRNTPFLHHDTPQPPKENLECSIEQVNLLFG